MQQRQIAHTQIEAEAELIRFEATAQAVRVKARAEQERLQAITKLLESTGGRAYIELERACVLRPTDKVIVPTESRIYLGTQNYMIEDD